MRFGFPFVDTRTADIEKDMTSLEYLLTFNWKLATYTTTSCFPAANGDCRTMDPQLAWILSFYTLPYNFVDSSTYALRFLIPFLPLLYCILEVL